MGENDLKFRKGVTNFLQRIINCNSSVFSCIELKESARLLSPSNFLYLEQLSIYFPHKESCPRDDSGMLDGYLYSEEAANDIIRPRAFGIGWGWYRMCALKPFSKRVKICFIHEIGSKTFFNLRVYSLLESLADITYGRISEITAKHLRLEKADCSCYVAFSSDVYYPANQSIKSWQETIFIQNVKLGNFEDILLIDTPKILIGYIPHVSQPSNIFYYLVNVDYDFHLKSIKEIVAQKYLVPDAENLVIVDNPTSSSMLLDQDIERASMHEDKSLFELPVKCSAKRFYNVLVFSKRETLVAIPESRSVEEATLQIDLHEALFQQYEIYYKMEKNKRMRRHASDLLIIDLEELQGAVEIIPRLSHFVSDRLFLANYDMIGFIGCYPGGLSLATLYQKEEEQETSWKTFLAKEIRPLELNRLSRGARYLFYSFDDYIKEDE